MKTKNEVADAIADRHAAWFKDRIREAYNAGWKDCEESLLERAQMMMEAARQMQEEDK